MNLEAGLLPYLAGVIFSLAMTYVPGFNEWYQRQTGEKKRLFVVGILALVALLVGVSTCLGWLDVVTCNAAGAKDVVIALFLALSGNQTMYQLTPRRPPLVMSFAADTAKPSE